MASASELQDRMELVRRLLVALVDNPDGYTLASDEQSIALEGNARPIASSLTLEQRTALVQAVTRIPWQSPAHLNRVQNALAAAGPPPHHGVPANLDARGDGVGLGSAEVRDRRSMQNFESLTNYFNEAEWMNLLSDSIVPSQKLQAILQRAHDLGLRCASEQTIKRITTMFLIVAEGAERAQAIPSHQKLATTKLVKRELKALGDNPLATYIRVLPADVSTFRSQYQPLYAHLFGAAPPAPMQLNLHIFAEVLVTVKCRGGREVAAPSGFQDIAAQFAQQMHGMQQMQMATLQALTGGQALRSGSGSGSGNRLPFVLDIFQSALASGSSTSGGVQGALRSGPSASGRVQGALTDGCSANAESARD